ncbi:MAG: hypothetical protein KatS3mg046_105 [Bellilinea sp.]|nr:MAG: hypothetical protein KatS3mg046_105 [Bellilinea sp.]
MKQVIVPLLIFVFLVAVLLLASEALTGEAWNTPVPTVWRVQSPSTSTPVPQVERTQWWAEITPPTPKPTLTPTVTETKAK